MKKLILLFIGILLYSCNTSGIYESEIQNKTFFIDFPEEIDLISDVKEKPDTVICYTSNDSLVFKFIVSERNQHYFKTINN